MPSWKPCNFHLKTFFRTTNILRVIWRRHVTRLTLYILLTRMYLSISSKSNLEQNINRLRNLRIPSHSLANVSSEKIERLGETLMIPPTSANKPRTISQDRIVQVEVQVTFGCNIITLVCKSKLSNWPCKFNAIYSSRNGSLFPSGAIKMAGVSDH